MDDTEPAIDPSKSSPAGDAENRDKDEHGPKQHRYPAPGQSGGDEPAVRTPDTADQPREIGGRKGPDPVRYGDWEKNGRCIDF